VSGRDGDPTDHLRGQPADRPQLVEALEEEGVTVQLPGRHTTECHDARDVAEGVISTLIAAGTIGAIRAGVRKVRWRFPGAKIEVEGEDD
jgi:hypothetical protein